MAPAILITRLSALARDHPRWTAAAAGFTAAALGWAVAGLVAAALASGYAVLGARAAVRRAAAVRQATAHSRTLDQLCALAADLRAGLPPTGPGTTLDGPGRLPHHDRAPDPARVPSVDARLGGLLGAVWRLAERTGAPVAELVERIEADVRAADRSRASAAAQAAGAKATALLLAALPAGGIALGYGIGVDPLQVLLHTPLGAACAGGTLVLQTAGLTWADRLAGGGPRR